MRVKFRRTSTSYDGSKSVDVLLDGERVGEVMEWY